MWHPEPGWRPLRAGSGPSTYGVWSATEAGREVVVKRLNAPGAGDPAELSDPGAAGYWRRAAEVAAAGFGYATPGLRSPRALRVEEDADGITLVHERIAEEALPGPFVAVAMGRFAGAELPAANWLAGGVLRSRLDRVAFRGGWTALARTTVADVAEHLWARREHFLRELDELPQVAQHGDPVPGNLPGRTGEHALAVDWELLGRGPVGGDVGYYSLSAREAFEPLVDAYCAGLPAGLAARAQVELGARVTAVFTVLTRADWALHRVVDGYGALAGKFRHPAVAPYLRAMQRQIPQIEQLLGW